MPTLLEEGLLISDRYRIHELIGSGGSGWVYRATQEPIGRPVAVKVLRTDLPEEDQIHFEARFLREASLAGQLQHPHIVTIHDYGRAPQGFCYLVMEYLEGYTFREVLRRHQVPTKRIMRIFDGITQGLRHAHAKGLVHRDVKPSNVFLLRGDGEEWRPKLMDFGLVREVHSEVTVTEVGTFLGTPQYIAPEQAMGLPTDARSDVYAVGVMLYRALCGKLPYAATNPAALAYMHVHQPYPPMAERAPGVDVPQRLEAICERCMKKEPAERYPDAGELLEDLRGVSRFVLGPDVLPPPDRSASRVAAVALEVPELPVPIEDELEPRIDTEETDCGSQVTVTDHLDTPTPLPPQRRGGLAQGRETLVPPGDEPVLAAAMPRRATAVPVPAQPAPAQPKRGWLLPAIGLLALGTVVLCGGLGAGLQILLGGSFEGLSDLSARWSGSEDAPVEVEISEAPTAPEVAVAEPEPPEPPDAPIEPVAEPVLVVADAGESGPPASREVAPPPPVSSEPSAQREQALNEVREALATPAPPPAVAVADVEVLQTVPEVLQTAPEPTSGGLGLSITGAAAEPLTVPPPSNEPVGLVIRQSSGNASAPVGPQGAVTVDEVSFTAAEAQRTLDWINSSSERDLKNAGLYSLGVTNILAQRPYGSLEVFAATHYVGKASVQAAKYAAHR